MSGPPLLAATGLSKRYRRRRVLDGLSLEIYPGETVGLLGSNGAGKTTCFNILAGIIPATGGSITFDGESIAGMPIDARAGMGISLLPQGRSVFASLSVRDNIRAVLEIRGGMGSKEMNATAMRLLHELKVEHLADAGASELSGGELRRVEIARALVTRPRLLLLDEPFAAIDPLTVADLQGILKQLSASGISLLISDHNVRETLAICDRGYILHEGTTLAAGTPGQLAENPQVREHYLGEGFRL